MKQSIFYYKYWTFITSFLLLLAACSKEDTNDGSPDVKPGSMTFASINTDSASGGSMLTVQGSGLGSIRSIIFDKNNAPAGFYSTLNTDKAILFRIPDTAAGGEQQIVLTNSVGKTLSIPFRVLAYPSVNSVSNYNFTEGSEITLTGLNLADVTSVTFTGTTTEIEIVSAESKNLVIKMPAANTINRAALNITNATGTITTTQEFVNIDNAYQIFTDAYGDGWSDNSWGDGGKISTEIFRTGTASVGKKYAKGNWHLINFVNWWPGLANDPAYKYLTVWVKGASQDYSLYITGDKTPGAFGDYIEDNRIDVPANVWSYFKIPLSTLKLWSQGSPLQQLAFRIQGPELQDETFYFDDLLLVK
ncbi:MAG: hypothetical protein KF862_14595 [Chitinophagaceae bacterium]|nr:hypothetical protein [Chitinophagaceae bacterium]